MAKKKQEKKELTQEEALAVLNRKAREKEQRVAAKIERLLAEEGYRMEVRHNIVLVPIR